METREQTPVILVNPEQIQEESITLSIETRQVLHNCPSYVEKNARTVRQETLEEFIKWFLV